MRLTGRFTVAGTVSRAHRHAFQACLNRIGSLGKLFQLEFSFQEIFAEWRQFACTTGVSRLSGDGRGREPR